MQAPRLRTGTRSRLETRRFYVEVVREPRGYTVGSRSYRTALRRIHGLESSRTDLTTLAVTLRDHDPASIVTHVVGREAHIAINTLSRPHGPARRARVTASHTCGSEPY